MNNIESRDENQIMSDELTNHFSLNMDAFSDGQMASKIWLSETIHKHWGKHIWPKLIVFGSWYGLLPFVLKLRNECYFEKLILCDIDAESIEISRKVLNHWVCKGLSIETHCVDCNKHNIDIKPNDLVINTSYEHIESLNWWYNLPKDVAFALQTTDMNHPTHVRKVVSMLDWKSQLESFSQSIFEGELFFSYPDKKFYRWMILGRK